MTLTNEVAGFTSSVPANLPPLTEDSGADVLVGGIWSDRVQLDDELAEDMLCDVFRHLWGCSSECHTVYEFSQRIGYVPDTLTVNDCLSDLSRLTHSPSSPSFMNLATISSGHVMFG